MKEICGICLQIANKSINISGDEALQDLWQVTQILTNSQYPSEDDDFMICAGCKQNVQSTVQLWLQLRKAQEFFAEQTRKVESKRKTTHIGPNHDRNVNHVVINDPYESSSDQYVKPELSKESNTVANKEQLRPKRSKRISIRVRNKRLKEEDHGDIQSFDTDDADDMDYDENDCEENVGKKRAAVKRRRKPAGGTKADVKRQKRPKRYRLEQYPSELVQVAIDRLKQKFYDNSDCVVCDFKSADNRGLSLHMAKLHKEIRESWCGLCNLLTENLQQHVKEHRRSSLRCTFCPMSFVNTVRLVEHLRWHCRADDLELARNEKSNTDDDDNSSDRDQNCDDENCGENEDSNVMRTKCRLQQFSHEEVLEAIQATQRPFELNRECLHCGFIAVHGRSLSVHMTLVHAELKANWCGTCNKMTEDMELHTKNHQQDVLKCQFCDKSFKKFGHLKEHLYSHSRLKSQTPYYFCNDCSEEFANRDTLTTHECPNKKSELYNKGTLKFCSICNRRVRCLALHRKQFHSNPLCQKDAPVKLCTVCGKQFRSNAKLTVHMRTHTGESPYKCSYCDRRVATRSHLIVHERIHTGEKPHVCEICGKAFAQSSVLNTHMKIHTGRPEICSVCDQRFCRPSELRLHMRKHTGEKPYLCNDCGLSFRIRSNLMEHLKVHTDERTHKCSFCEKAFKQNSSLRKHELIHTGDKPFKCTECSFSSRQNYNLTVHMKTHRKTEIEDSTFPTTDLAEQYACESCPEIFSSEEQLMSHIAFQHDNIETVSSTIEDNQIDVNALI